MKPLSRIIGLAFLLTACVQSEDIAPLETEAPVPVVFDTYIAAGNTRTADITHMDNAALKETGFGVFAKVNNSETQDFMFNQEVTYSSGNWAYTPLKFWPGPHQTYEPETFNTLSFYAYAPYKSITEPKISYTATDYPTWGTDLLWAILTNQAIPVSDAKTTLTFYHACVRLGLQVVANYDEEDNEGKTKILIENVKIQDNSENAVSIDALRKRGTLNLTSGTAPYQPYWTNLGDAFALPSVIDDTHHLNTELKYAPLQPIGIPNSGVDENGFCARGTRSVKTISAQFEALPEGVTTTAKPLQEPVDGEAYYYTLVPDPSKYNTVDAENPIQIPIKITYHVITLDSSLPKGFSDTAATGSAYATITNFQAGHIYTLLLRIGLKHISATCTATEWGGQTTGNLNIP